MISLVACTILVLLAGWNVSIARLAGQDGDGRALRACLLLAFIAATAAGTFAADAARHLGSGP